METTGRTVLIVDDNLSIRNLLRLTLELGDFEVVGEAQDATEALSIASEFLPTLVILDHMLPQVTGEDTAGLIREAVPGIRIVAFSAVIDERPDWADAHLRKLDVPELPDLLETLVA